MLVMNSEQPAFPIPGDTAWYTPKGAAEKIGCNYRTVLRMIEDSRLPPYRPHGATGEDVPVLIYAEDVYRMTEAWKRTRPKGNGNG